MPDGARPAAEASVSAALCVDNNVECTFETNLLPCASITECVSSRSDESVVDPCLVDGWSSLHYVDVEIDGLLNPITAVDDSGCQLCCVRADVVAPLGLPKLGHVMLHGVGNDPVSADVMKLNVKLMNGRDSVPITAAVCDKMNGELILGSDIVNKLHDQLLHEQYETKCHDEPVVMCVGVNENITAVNNNSNDDDESENDEQNDVVNEDVDKVAV